MAFNRRGLSRTSELPASACAPSPLENLCHLSNDGSYLDDAKPASMKNTGVDQAGRDDAGDG